MSLDPAHFDDWFSLLNGGRHAFPWQRRLFHEWLLPADLGRARWPALIQLPTASGKTAIIDLAVLALAAGSPCARRRIIFVVDRRVVVDQASVRAEAITRRLAEALATPADPLNEIARSLLALGGDLPLAVARLRGGAPGDDTWARSPAQPAVVLSTVDQVGSALLFRAYGAHGPRSWPIYAGLLGRDALLIVDEAHCAAPFCQTARAIAEQWQGLAESPVGGDLALVRMSATPGEAADFTLDQGDRLDVALARRLAASKPAELVTVQAEGGGQRTVLVREMVTRAAAAVHSMSDGVAGVVVNRVADARAIFAQLDLSPDRKLLLTGRARPWERDQLLQRWLPRLQAGRSRVAEPPVVVVATQCIEVGADLDFDLLVTEAAPLDALRQRFGRLNRLGDRLAARAVVIATAGQVELSGDGTAKGPDPIYGHALARTWGWLTERALGESRVLDFGVDELEPALPTGEELALLCQDLRAAYPLLPAHLDLLVQTSPPPEPSPEVSAFLHGTTRSSSDVAVVWRADLPETKPGVWADRVAVQPPATGEGCLLPLWELRRWLTSPHQQAAAGGEESGDVEGAEALNVEEEPLGQGRRALRWRGLGEADLVMADQVSAGDTLVVPATYGGCDELGWNPASAEPVVDLGDAVAYDAGRRLVLRLGPLARLLAEDAGVAGALDGLRAWAAGEDEAPAPRVALKALAGSAAAPAWLRGLAQELAVDGRLRAVDAGGAYALTGGAHAGEGVSTADDESAYGAATTLAHHSAGVEEYARRYARAVGLPEGLVADIALAGWLHDVGKADPRFQVWLLGGDEVAAALAQEPLAKSAQNPRNRGAVLRARRIAGYPSGARHEAQSLALITSVQQVQSRAADWDLVQHLVVSHHGFARPFLPSVPDPEPVFVALKQGDIDLGCTSNHELFRLENGVAERYWRLVRRYGWWGLAWLEAVLRLADHRCSEDERQKGQRDG